MTDFNSLGLDARLLKALAQEGYEAPTPIQAQAIPHVLAGRDLLGIAQTGTGKTASFALPILQRLSADKRVPAPKTARALVLSPTRELSAQIADSFRTYGRFMNLSVTTVFGGVSEHAQKQTMSRGVDILVATPGRLLDLVNQRAVTLGQTEVFVLDEADRMLDMGFINDIRKLVSGLPRERQNLFFSATMPQEIGSLASDLLRNPERVSVTPAATTVERIAQRVIHVENSSKRALLVELLRTDANMNRTLVFTRTKHGADKIVRALDCAGIVSSAIHGNKSQSQRVSTLNAFRSGRTRVLIATDIAARGIDVDGISHVINFDLPHVPESYVHRIGRTARAGAEGIAIAFCDREERALLRDIERVTRQQIPSSEWRVRPGSQEATDTSGQERAEPRSAPREPRPDRGPRPGATGPGAARPGAPRHKFEAPMQHRKGGRPFGDAPTGERRNDAPATGAPEGASPYARQDAGRREDTRSEGARPAGKRFGGPRSDGPNTRGPRPEGSRPEGKRFGGPRTDGPRPEGQRPEGKRFAGPRPEGQRPEGKRFAGPRPEGQRPEGQRFGGPRPEGQRPEGKRFEGARTEGPRPFVRKEGAPGHHHARKDGPHARSEGRGDSSGRPAHKGDGAGRGPVQRRPFPGRGTRSAG